MKKKASEVQLVARQAFKENHAVKGREKLAKNKAKKNNKKNK